MSDKRPHSMGTLSLWGMRWGSGQVEHISFPSQALNSPTVYILPGNQQIV